MAQTLFTNAKLLLDGRTSLQPGHELLVQDGLIQAVSATPLPRAPGMTVIDVGQRTLMPGLIDAHAHIMGLSLTPKNIAYPAAEIAMASVNYLRNCLMDGFTTIREAGGADHATARLLGEGTAIGPRLFYSGKALTQTGGGADFRTPDETPRPLRPCRTVLQHVGHRRRRRRDPPRGARGTAQGRDADQAVRLRWRGLPGRRPCHALRVQRRPSCAPPSRRPPPATPT